MQPVVVKPNSHKTIIHLLDDHPIAEFVVQEHSQVTVVIYAKGTASLDASVSVRLTGDHSSATILGLFILNKEHKISLHTLQYHKAYDTTSNLLVKSVLKDSAHFSYDGAIRVEKEGQKTNAYQRNENLILSNTAVAQSKPSLEILADDVRCTHGATIGTIDEEQLFFLSTRGISKTLGKQLIVEGFLLDALMKVDDQKAVENIQDTLWQNL